MELSSDGERYTVPNFWGGGREGTRSISRFTRLILRPDSVHSDFGAMA